MADLVIPEFEAILPTSGQYVRAGAEDAKLVLEIGTDVAALFVSRGPALRGKRLVVGGIRLSED